MKRKNTTRSALFTSVISLLLCVSMLVGTTFAWFTDEVKSGINTIAAGNLDVELYYSKTKDFADEKKVDTQTVLFTDKDGNEIQCWEPGVVAYTNLQVKNAGTLALKYQMKINAENNNYIEYEDGTRYTLADALKVAVVDGGFTGNRAAAQELAYTETLESFILGGELSKGQTSRTYGIVIYWEPGDNDTDNLFNMNNGKTSSDGEPLSIDLGINLFATQLEHEFDSFGNDYDAEAGDEQADPWEEPTTLDWYFENPNASAFEIRTAGDLAGLAALVNGTATSPVTTLAGEAAASTVQESFKGKTITLTGDIDLGGHTWTPIGNSKYSFKGIFDGNGKTVKYLRITGNGSNVGLFGYTTEGEIKNLTIHNAYVSGRLNVGVVAGTPYTSKYTNIKVTGHVEVNGMAYVGGVGGKNAYASWDNITVAVDETSYVKANSVENGTAYRTYVGGVIGFMGEGGHKISNVTSNIDVIGSTCDVGGIVGIAHYGNTFENTVCTGDVTITNATESGEAEEMGGIAGVWHNGGSNVIFTNCTYTGKLTANFTEGVDLSDNTIAGNPYGTGTGKLIIDGVTTCVVSDATVLKDALSNAQTGDTIILTAGTYAFPASSLKNGVTLNCAEGTVFEGTSKLNIKGATVIGATFSNPTGTAADQTINGIFKDCTFTGKNGLRWCYAGETVVFENCVFNGSAYGVHFDGGANQVIFKNCTFSGFNAMGGAITKLIMDGCTFQATGKSNYNGINLWGNTEMTDCTFVFDGSVDNEWVDLCNDNQTVCFTNCVVTDGTNETPIVNVVGNYGNGNTIIIDDVTVDIPNMN